MLALDPMHSGPFLREMFAVNFTAVCRNNRALCGNQTMHRSFFFFGRSSGGFVMNSAAVGCCREAEEERMLRRLHEECGKHISSGAICDERDEDKHVCDKAGGSNLLISRFHGRLGPLGLLGVVGRQDCNVPLPPESTSYQGKPVEM